MYPTPPDSPVQKRKSSFYPPFIPSSKIQPPMSYAKFSRRRSTRRVSRAVLTSKSGDIYGKKISCSRTPPNHLKNKPVFKIVRLLLPAGVNVIRPDAIAVQDAADYGLTATNPRYLGVNIISVRAWDATGTRLTISGTTDNGLFIVEDEGTNGAESSATGYMMPLSYRTKTFGTGTTINLFTVNSSVATVVDIFVRFQ